MGFSDILTVGYPFSKLRGLIPLELMVRGVPQTPKTIQTIRYSLDCLRELDGKPPHCRHHRHKPQGMEISLCTDRKLPPWWLVLESAVWAAGVGRESERVSLGYAPSD